VFLCYTRPKVGLDLLFKLVVYSSMSELLNLMPRLYDVEGGQAGGIYHRSGAHISLEHGTDYVLADFTCGSNSFTMRFETLDSFGIFRTALRDIITAVSGQAEGEIPYVLSSHGSKFSVYGEVQEDKLPSCSLGMSHYISRDGTMRSLSLAVESVNVRYGDAYENKIIRDWCNRRALLYTDRDSMLHMDVWYDQSVFTSGYRSAVELIAKGECACRDRFYRVLDEVFNRVGKGDQWGRYKQGSDVEVTPLLVTIAHRRKRLKWVYRAYMVVLSLVLLICMLVRALSSDNFGVLGELIASNNTY